MSNRAAHLFERAERDGAKAAIIFEGETITFAELARRVSEAAGGLARLGVAKGTRVGIMIPSQPDWVVVQQALFALGAVVSPLNVFYRPGEVAHAIRSCDLELLVLPSDMLDRAPHPNDETLPSLRQIVVIDHEADMPLGGSLPRTIAAGEPLETLAEVAANDVVMLLHTSATTGKSKGVMLTAGNLAANYDRTPGWLGLTGSDVILCALPLYNTFGLNQCINAMMTTGATMVLLPRFDAKRCIHAIHRYHCTFLPGVPTMLQKIIDDPDLWPGALASIDRVMTGGAPVPAVLLRRILAATSPATVVLTGYGLTEGTALVTLTEVGLGPDGEVMRGRTIGKVREGMALAVEGLDGRMLGPDEVGEFVVQGPNVMLAYYRAPDDTAAALASGWLHTGDIGYIDADGYAYIVDRKKDVIIRGGQNIYPADIEEVIYKVDGVAEAAVVGMADDLLGEVPVAFVAPRPGCKVSESTIIEHCKADLAHYKVPVAVHTLRELPKGPTGKILRRELRPLAQSAA